MIKAKENIIQKAFGLFMSLGYKEVTLALILKETGLSKGGFYHHFGSKEELFEQVVDQFFFLVASDEGFQPSPQKSFLENMDAFLEQKETAFEMFAQHLGVEHSEINFFIFIMQAIKHLPGVRQKVSLFLQKEKQQLENIVAMAQLKNEIRNDVQKTHLADHLMYLFDGAEMHGVMLSQSFETVSRERNLVRQLYSWVSVSI